MPRLTHADEPPDHAPPRASRRVLRLLHDHGALLVVIIALVVTFASIANHELWTPDEPREAQIGREMLAAGFTATPTLSGEPFVEKPPLYPWAVAASYSVLGVSAAAARVPAALFSTLAVLFAFLLARRMAGSVAGVAAAAVLLTTSKFGTTSTTAINDTALTAFVAGGHLCFVMARGSPRRIWPLVGAGCFAALAFMAKGVIGPILIGGPAVLALVTMREWTALRTIVPRAAIVCGVIVAGVAGAWVLALARESGWDLVRESLWNNTAARTLGDAGREFGSYGHSKPPWYYVKAFPVGLLPWSLALPAVWVSGVLRKRRRGGAATYVAAIVLTGIVLLSVPAGKRTLYFMPLLPAAAAVFGVWISRIGSRSEGRLDRGTLTLLLAITAAACTVVGAVLLVTAVSGAPNDRLRPLLENPIAALAAVAALALAGAGTFAFLTRRAWTRCSPSVARAALIAGVLAAGLSGAVGRALLDPMEEMRTGAERALALVSPQHRLAGLKLRETEAAVLSFYSGRPLTNCKRLAEVLSLAKAGAVRDVFIEDVPRTADLRATLAARSVLVERIELKPGDFIEIYRVEPGGR